MDQQYSQQLEQRLQSNWTELLPKILNEFTTISTADIQAARGVDDLVSRIADKSHYSERFVTTKVAELVGVGAPTGSAGMGETQPWQGTARPFGTPER